MPSKMRIEFGEVRLGKTARYNILGCLDRNWITAGPLVTEFEQQYAKVMGYTHVRAVNSGTSADFVACLCLYDLVQAQPGDEIIVPALGFIAAQNSVRAAGFTPIPCDIRVDTLNIDESQIERLLTPKTKAILAINTMGKPCRMDVLRQICDAHQLILIIDNCEAHGCEFQDHNMSHYGDIVTYSFYSAHIVFACQMGAICTNRVDVADLATSIRTHGRKNGAIRFDHERFGWNCQPNDLCAAVGLESLANFTDIFRSRLQNLHYYIDMLHGPTFHVNLEEDTDKISPHALSLVFKDDDASRFDRFYEYLLDHGIHCKLNFKSVFTQQPAMAWFGYRLGDFPNAEHVGRNGLHLACHQYLTAADLIYVVDTVQNFVI